MACEEGVFAVQGELGVQIVHVVETAAEEKVLLHIAEGPLDLAFGPIWLADSWRRTVMGQQRHKGIVIDDDARSLFTDDTRASIADPDVARYCFAPDAS